VYIERWEGRSSLGARCAGKRFISISRASEADPLNEEGMGGMCSNFFERASSQRANTEEGRKPIRICLATRPAFRLGSTPIRPKKRPFFYSCSGPSNNPFLYFFSVALTLNGWKYRTGTHLYIDYPTSIEPDNEGTNTPQTSNCALFSFV
jgi:hypothetical protein